jgi:hypothetical protein
MTAPSAQAIRNKSRNSSHIGKAVLCFGLAIATGCHWFQQKRELAQTKDETERATRAYHQAKIQQKEGYISRTALNELHGWKNAEDFPLLLLNILSEMPKELTLGALSLRGELCPTTLPQEQQTPVFNQSLLLKTDRVSIELRDAGNNQGRHTYHAFLDKIREATDLPATLEQPDRIRPDYGTENEEFGKEWWLSCSPKPIYLWSAQSE